MRTGANRGSPSATNAISLRLTFVKVIGEFAQFSRRCQKIVRCEPSWRYRCPTARSHLHYARGMDRVHRQATSDYIIFLRRPNVTYPAAPSGGLTVAMLRS